MKGGVGRRWREGWGGDGGRGGEEMKGGVGRRWREGREEMEGGVGRRWREGNGMAAVYVSLPIHPI